MELSSSQTRLETVETNVAVERCTHFLDISHEGLKDIVGEAVVLLYLFIKPLDIWPGFEQFDELPKILEVKAVVIVRSGLLNDRR